MQTEAARGGLSANALKFIAVAAMTLDHYAWAFVPTASVAGQVLHLFGRLTAPIMCFFIAEGYAHTRDVGRYLLRLGVFALLSHLPYTFFSTDRLTFVGETGVIYTLFLSLLALVIWDSALPGAVRALLLAAVFFASTAGDWSYYAVAWTLVFHLTRSDPLKRALGYYFVALAAAVTLFVSMGSRGVWWLGACQFGTLLAYPLLLLYNGQRGRLRVKWFFYVYYPAHLVLLALWRHFVWYGRLW